MQRPGRPDPRRMSEGEINRYYHQSEDAAKRALELLRNQASIDSGNHRAMAALISQVFLTSQDAIDFRMEVRRWRGPDRGHDNAILHIYDNIVQVAENIRACNNIYVERPKPAKPNLPQRHPRDVSDEFNNPVESHNDATFTTTRASFLDPDDESCAYFLCNCFCAHVEVKISTTDDVLLDTPCLLLEKWSCLADAGFYIADAVLPNPNNKEKELYFFYREQYVLINIKENRIVNGPKSIVGEWPSISQSQFQSIDAVLPIMSQAVYSHDFERMIPQPAENAYFFSGTSYSLIKIAPGTTDDEIVNGPKIITEEWPSLRTEGFSTIDSVLPVPTRPGEAYFFKGEKYCRVEIAPGTNDDEIVLNGRNISENWPSLKNAFFY